MSDTPDLSRVIALSHKGNDLARKGHDARAAENFSRAAEEAEKTILSPDCLVLCMLRQEQIEALLRHATRPAAKPADADDAVREAVLRLQPSVMAVLERRMAAGTLLPGSCRPVEERYQMPAMLHNLGLDRGRTQAWAAKGAAIAASYVGLEAFFRVASSLAFVLYSANDLKPAVVLSNEQAYAGCLFLTSALDLMTQPRDLDTWLPGEPELVRHLRILIPAVRNMDDQATKKLRAAWRRMLRSGVLRAHGIDEGIDENREFDVRIRAALDAELAAGRLQLCALEGCTARESHPSQFKRCGACRMVAYCCREHQVEDWQSHKAACKAARKAADAAGTSGA